MYTVGHPLAILFFAINTCTGNIRVRGRVSVIPYAMFGPHTSAVKRQTEPELTSKKEMASELQQQPALPVTLLQLEDVYEIATRVSEEFQVLASQFGSSRLSKIIPTVLDALEHLENVVTANQQLEIRVRKLILGNDTLMKEKAEANTELKVQYYARAFAIINLVCEVVKLCHR